MRKTPDAPSRLATVYRITVYFDAEPGEAEAVHDRVGELLRRHALASSRREAGYAVALAQVPQPTDDDEFVALVAADAERVLVGPPELLDDEPDAA